MSVSLEDARRSLREASDPAKAKFYPKYFKTGPGEYAEGDRFLGVTVPDVRRVARNHRDLAAGDVEALLRSPWHEERLLGLLIWVEQHRRGDERERMRIARRYLALRRHVNNWDLIDTSAPYVLGPHLDEIGHERWADLLRSGSVWDRRIAVLATFHEIRQGRFERFFQAAEALRNDSHDLIHKAVGWMLREVGNRDEDRLRAFLRIHQATLPRTMLRYAIERLPAPERRAFLEGRG